MQLTVKDNEQSAPFVSYNNKMIFLILVDIFPRRSASKRSGLMPIEITEQDFIQNIEKSKGT